MKEVVDKARALQLAKRRAGWFLAAATGLFFLSLMMKGPPVWPVELLRSMSEAAMVGGLADWFAVTALFRSVNLLGLIPVFPAHTAVIPRSKERIASSLADFVRDHFLKTETLVAMVKARDPARVVASWLLEKENAHRFAVHAAQFLSWALTSLHEGKVQALIDQTIRDAFRGVDLSRTTGEILEAMLKHGQHHELLDVAIARLTAALRDPGTQARIATKIAEYIRDEYPKAQLVLPTEAIGRAVSGGVAAAIERYLGNVSQQPGHEMREAFDRAANELIVRLKGDCQFASKGEEIKAYILEDKTFNGYLGSLWATLRDTIERDLRDPESEIQKKLADTGDWIGATLADDEDLRASFNRRVEALVAQFGPNLGQFVSSHIEGTIKLWDPRAMSVLIEENIGTDLQAIRINGTLIGGLLGGALFAVAYASSRLL